MLDDICSQKHCKESGNQRSQYSSQKFLLEYLAMNKSRCNQRSPLFRRQFSHEVFGQYQCIMKDQNVIRWCSVEFYSVSPSSANQAFPVDALLSTEISSIV